MKHKFEKFCKDYENIENYYKAKADNFNGWNCHHRLETHTSDGKRRDVDITVAELQALDMYYNRPASELIFLRKGEHSSLRKVSDSTRKKLSTANKGEKNPMYGKHHTEESKRKNAEAHKGKPKYAETRKKIGMAKRGTHWFNNGKISKRAKECPEGFVPGRIKKL